MKQVIIAGRRWLPGLLLGLGPLAAWAQQPTSGGPAPQDTEAATEVPLDGGAGLLAVAGAGYALRRLRVRRAHS